MMVPTTSLHITDKTGAKFFRVTCSTAYKSSEIRNLQHHIDNAGKFPKEYNFLDFKTAKIVEREIP